jgi:acetylornithine deacetylase/succinyl-diaminopimelate desuccinylase-like protein
VNLESAPTACGRLFEWLEELYAIGGGRGANRPYGSAAEDAAHDLAAGWMEAAGLAVERDRAGNLLGRFPGEGAELWAGSHLDSVPEGGRFDGTLGVVAAIEALERIGPQSRPLAAVAFRGEEVGCIGSRARCDGGALPGGLVEVHIEQGPRLAAAGAPLGVVTAIVGYARREVVFEGAAGHAGTTPMDQRDDALVAAAEYVLRARDAARAIPEAVATVGVIEAEPGGINVVPGRVRLTVDARAPDVERLERLLTELGLELQPRTDPVALDAELRSVLAAEAARLGTAPVELPSGAGHDAGILAAAGVPSAMLFVRSLAGGVSHSPDEESSAEDVALAVDVLAGALARLSVT